MPAAVWLLGFGLRMAVAVTVWVFHRPLAMIPVRLGVLALVLVLASQLTGTHPTPCPASPPGRRPGVACPSRPAKEVIAPHDQHRRRRLPADQRGR